MPWDRESGLNGEFPLRKGEEHDVVFEPTTGSDVRRLDAGQLWRATEQEWRRAV